MGQQIKKYILSFFVVATFAFYAVSGRPGNQADNPADSKSSDKDNLAGSGAASAEPSAITAPPIIPPPPAPPPARAPAINQTAAVKQTYKDGEFTGAVADAYYGKVQVRITVRGGKITEAAALDYPKENQTSVLINNQAIPALKSETIKAQSARIDAVSGATYTSYAFAASLDSALGKARTAAPSSQAAKPPILTPPAPPAPVPPPAITQSAPAAATGAVFKDGQFTGDSIDVFYGLVQVKTTIQGGKLTDVQFLSYPQNQQTSVSINTRATPILRSEALAAQSAQVNIVSGATYTSTGFIQSLTSALNQASGTSSQTQTPQSVQLQLPRPGLDDDEKYEDEYEYEDD